ncbi:MAG: cytochrome c family protein [Roseitalea sp.]|jgi:cytochrome c|uniref:Cytochrome c family protein n=1 Tax=Oceaniradius stylonematis TaxID=2184161 RepID=A0A3A8ALJ9_9HYPH|nr:cytochrome c family protein [Oceaniradius stylonematis]MBO6553394.1 cytochrome c family protein [Roseitalea sp.]MBO6952437.1 cytochrome c family protein [Rhizobiaceae bacterium]MBO6593077.1 cytochrome c family protein [Roseitalea sp.]MBO6600181.1 cytochrome c family protein [Roseitalea sp.]MBO6613778.1 cytochrome c family protein [Roseitalea sp.]
MNTTMYAGAFLGTVFVVMTVGLASDAIFSHQAPEQEGFAIIVEESEGTAVAVEEVDVPISVLLASADASNGEGVFRKCQSCHNIESGAGHKTGPNLWNIVGKEVALYDEFRYSQAMQDYAEGGTVWDFDSLNNFLAAPKDYIDGTSMSFAGLPRDGERADLIAWLATQNDSPVALPEPEAAPAEEAAAEGDAAETTATE